MFCKHKIILKGTSDMHMKRYDKNANEHGARRWDYGLFMAFIKSCQPSLYIMISKAFSASFQLPDHFFTRYDDISNLHSAVDQHVQ